MCKANFENTGEEKIPIQKINPFLKKNGNSRFLYDDKVSRTRKFNADPLST